MAVLNLLQGQLASRHVGIIPTLRENPKIVVRDDAEVVRDGVAEVAPFVGESFSEKYEYCIGKLLLRGIILIVCDTAVYDGPQSFNRVEMRAIWRQ